MAISVGLKKWHLEDLKRSLENRSEVKTWVITEDHVTRGERYFIGGAPKPAIDQDRQVEVESIKVHLVVYLKDHETRQGEIVSKFSYLESLGPQVEKAIQSAQKTSLQSWSLPEKVKIPDQNLKMADPQISEDIHRALERLTTEMEEAVAIKRPTQFNSAEIFVSVYDRSLHFSNGLNYRTSRSRVYGEAAFSMKKNSKSQDLSRSQIQSDEYLNRSWAVSLQDLSLKNLFEDTSQKAEKMVQVDHPKPGRYSVLLDADVLNLLFNDYLNQVSGFNLYNGLPAREAGEELVQGAQGDLISFMLDPYFEYGAGTTALSSQGILQKPLQVVKDNRVLCNVADKQYADYLDIPSTTTCGTIVVEPGRLSYEELIRSQSRVLEILQFSGLFTDSSSGTFSSEIRLARLHDRDSGQTTYIKGGSLSGSIFSNFTQAYFSSNRVKKEDFTEASYLQMDMGQSYYGPEYALLNDVSIAS